MYMQPMGVHVQQSCPRIAGYHQELLAAAQRNTEVPWSTAEEEVKRCIYTYTDGDIRETLPFLFLRMQRTGGGNLALPVCLHMALLETLFPLEPPADAQQKQSFFIMAQLEGMGRTSHKDNGIDASAQKLREARVNVTPSIRSEWASPCAAKPSVCGIPVNLQNHAESLGRLLGRSQNSLFVSVGISIECVGSSEIFQESGVSQGFETEPTKVSLFHWVAEEVGGASLIFSSDRKSLEGRTAISIKGKGDGVAAFGEASHTALVST
ncbi:putative seryl-tRNA synthetase [Cyclospora cayetanensis]|uniref:Seryl-tRNA synthetase n=1 Tax=Cyclospora cayetanensis TaxID=88456 RepID=A0A1D3CRK4_9EIME|nr:putative seryl-tRNA synthetase [Cyclospora cayetanensis]